MKDFKTRDASKTIDSDHPNKPLLSSLRSVSLSDRIGNFAGDESGFDLDEKTYIIETDIGRCCVGVRGNINTNPVILTVHDIGLNHFLCFTSLFSNVISREKNIFSRFSIVHIDIPGQQFDASDLKVDSLEMDDLVSLIDVVRNYLKINQFIGLGAGAGSYLLTKYATKYLNHVKALILISGTSHKVGQIEQGENISNSLAELFNYKGVLKNSLLNRYFTEQTNSELYNQYSQKLDTLNRKNVKKFVDGYQNRTHISDSAMASLNIPILIFLGELSSTQEETFQMRACMNFKNTEFVSIPGFGHLLSEECPDLLLEPIQLFLNSMGYVVRERPLKKSNDKET